MAVRDNVSQAELGRRTGLSRRVLLDLSTDGVIPRNADGTYPLRACLRALAARRKANDKPPAASAAAELKEANQRAQVCEREAKAEQRELELRERRGDLVDVVLVQADARAACEIIRSKLLALPGRVALQVEALVAGEPDARAARIEALIADEVNVALEALHKTKFGGVTQ